MNAKLPAGGLSTEGKLAGNLDTQSRHNLVFKPGIAAEPQIVARAGVRHGYDIGKPRLPVPHPFSQRDTRCLWQMISLRVVTQGQYQLCVWHPFQQFAPPSRGTFGSWRQIATLAFSWITESHGQERNAVSIVEHVFADPDPLPQPVPAWVVEGNSRRMNARSRCLPRDKDASSRTPLHDWPRPQRQMHLAQPASPDFGCESVIVLRHRH